MKITVSVNGRFHAFDLARQLHKHGHLHCLMTTYPAAKVVEWGIPAEKIKAFPLLEVLKRTKRFVPPAFRKSIVAWQMKLFDRCVSKRLPVDSDLFICWSGSSLQSIKACKRRSIQTVLERGSAHILTQMDLLTSEYATHGLTFRAPLERAIQRELKEYEETDFLEVPSTFARRTFVDRGYGEEKILMGFRGVDLRDFKPAPKQDDVFRVVFAGGMSLQKGSHYLLQAVHELDLPKLEFWHLGVVSEEMDTFLEKYRSRKIHCLGHQPQAELYKYYSQGSVFVLPSIQDGFGMVQTQAMACGLPLICTKNTGGPDIIEDGKEGYVVPIRDVDTLKERIRFLYENPSCARAMGENARKKVERGWTWDDFGRHIIQTYRDIMDSENRAAKAA